MARVSAHDFDLPAVREHELPESAADPFARAGSVSRAAGAPAAAAYALD